MSLEAIMTLKNEHDIQELERQKAKHKELYDYLATVDCLALPHFVRHALYRDLVRMENRIEQLEGVDK